MEDHKLHTICDSGKCPNKAECWSRRTATFMILGDICTRSCKFCATMTGKPLPPDAKEPEEVAESIRLMGLRHAVITSVDRDDLPDGGAEHWAATVREIRKANPETTIELLIPDFDGRKELIDIVIDSGPDIIGHNIETVRRLTPLVRSRAKYDTSLEVLRYIALRGAMAKSGIMLGLCETEEEILSTLDDLADAGCSKNEKNEHQEAQAGGQSVMAGTGCPRLCRMRVAAAASVRCPSGWKKRRGTC